MNIESIISVLKSGVESGAVSGACVEAAQALESAVAELSTEKDTAVTTALLEARGTFDELVIAAEKALAAQDLASLAAIVEKAKSYTSAARVAKRDALLAEIEAQKQKIIEELA